jgi:chloramphenicol-sensitive protein RarD
MLAGVVTLLRRWPPLIRVARDGRSLRLLVTSTLLVAANWYAFIWAVTHDRLVEASLGYFMNPLVNVLLGFLFLKERLRALEWMAIALAAFAVTWLAIHADGLPWIALTVATSFGLYGLVRKIAAVPAIEGLTIETAILAPLAAWLLVMRGSVPDLLLLASGPVTAIPLIWFAAAVQRLRLATMGLLQYLSPSIQFVVAVSLYHEPLGRERFAAFVMIWCAIAMYSAANVRRVLPPAPAAAP